MDVFQYKTLSTLSEGFYKEKGSKFIGYAIPCYSEEEAKGFLEKWRKEHHQARHLCYAYRFGADHSVYRANDDGEPNNSAGIPILGQIKSFELTNVLIGVIRYYGGTKLGVGGLINAYKEAAREAVLNGKIVEKEVYKYWELQFSYNEMPDVMSLIKRHQIEMRSSDFGVSCNVIIEVPLRIEEEVVSQLSDIEGVKLLSNG